MDVLLKYDIEEKRIQWVSIILKHIVRWRHVSQMNI